MAARDTVMPTGPWEFDEDVTGAFDDMLARSIPDYEGMRATVSDIAARFMPKAGDTLLDLGCSRGQSIAALVDRFGEARYFRGLEISDPMREAAMERFAGHKTVWITRHDLRDAKLPSSDWAVILSVLTLQFTPIEYRQRILADAFRALRPGGALVLVEKVLGQNAPMDAMLIDAYYDGKRAAGYTDEQIDRKRLSLEGVLVPVTARWNEELLMQAGFRSTEVFWRRLNFCAWLAVK